MGLSLTVQPPRTTVDLPLSLQGRLQTILNTTAAHPLHRGYAHLQGPDNLLVFHAAASLILIAEQQDAGMCLLVSRRPSFGHQRHQFLLLVLPQPYPVPLHHHHNLTSQLP